MGNQPYEKSNEIYIMRHSLSHVLAAAVLKMFPDAKLGIGPAIDNGFYYDFILPRSLNAEDLAAIEKDMKQFIKEDLYFIQKFLYLIAFNNSFGL